jgi:hypothetical protein
MEPENKQEYLYAYLKKADLKPKLVRREKEDHFILIKEAIHQKETTIVNIYA